MAVVHIVRHTRNTKSGTVTEYTLAIIDGGRVVGVYTVFKVSPEGVIECDESISEVWSTVSRIVLYGCSDNGVCEEARLC